MLPIRLPSSIFQSNQQSGAAAGRLQPHVVPPSPSQPRACAQGQASPNSAHSSGTTTTRTSQVQVKPFTKASLDKKSRRNRATIRDYGFQPRSKLSIQDGAVLPTKYEPFPDTLYGKALEEIDQFIYDETFCVVSKRFRKNYIHRFTATNSLFIFSAWGYLRRTCIFISTNQYFDYMVMTTILLNCVFLAKTESVEEAEYIFLAIYTAEMIIKIVAKGFFINKYTYLRNPWNWLDFIVIASGYATIGMEVGNLAGLRTFRVLRALKTVSIMPGLKTIINALLHSFKQLAEVMTLTIFCLMVFALFALQVYMGELRNKCVAQFNGTSWADLGRNQTAYGREWKKWINNDRHWLMSPDNDPVICGNVTGARKCPAGYVCLKAGDNPNHGYTNFDNFLWSMLTTFQLITLDYWENVYNMVLASSGPLSVVFFTVVVFFGSFYLINLMLAVVALSYEEEAEITQEERRKDLTDHRDDSTFSFDPTKIPVKKLDKNNMKKIDSKKGILLSSYSRKRTRRRKRRGAMAVTGNESQISGTASRSVTPSPEPDTPPDEEEEEEEPPRGDNVAPSLNQGPPLPSVSCNADDNKLHPDNALVAPGVRINRGQLSSRQASSNASEGNNRESSLDDSGVVDDHEDNDMGEDVNQSLHPVTPSSVVLQKITERMKVPPSQRLPPPEEQTDLRLKKKCNGSIQQIYTLPTSADYMSQVVVLDNLVDRNCAKCPECCIDYESWLRFQNGLYRIVRDPLFELLITLCIILNTMFLAVEHHGMSQSMRDVLDYGNKVFTLVFTLECILKVMALSNDYFQCGWNIFDLIVVTASLVDLMTEFVDGLSVLRGLRLLRVLKLAQSWTTMKVLLSIIISTIGALGNLTFVLVIVIYIFAVIGMQLFSKDYTSEKFAPDPVPRWNFSDFFHSFMMIFRILCGEWIEPLWDCMRAEEYQQGSGTCFAIFLPALVMGNFMVLNLFLALLLNSFNSDELKSKKEKPNTTAEDEEIAQMRIMWSQHVTRVSRLCAACRRCCLIGGKEEYIAMRVTRDDPDGCVAYGSPCRAREDGGTAESVGNVEFGEGCSKDKSSKNAEFGAGTVDGVGIGGISSNDKAPKKKEKKSKKPKKPFDRSPDGDDSEPILVNEKYPHLKLDLKNTKNQKTSKPRFHGDQFVSLGSAEPYGLAPGEPYGLAPGEPANPKGFAGQYPGDSYDNEGFHQTPLPRKKLSTIQTHYGQDMTYGRENMSYRRENVTCGRDNYSYIGLSSEDMEAVGSEQGLIDGKINFDGKLRSVLNDAAEGRPVDARADVDNADAKVASKAGKGDGNDFDDNFGANRRRVPSIKIIPTSKRNTFDESYTDTLMDMDTNMGTHPKSPSSTPSQRTTSTQRSSSKSTERSGRKKPKSRPPSSSEPTDDTAFDNGYTSVLSPIGLESILEAQPRRKSKTDMDMKGKPRRTSDTDEFGEYAKETSFSDTQKDRRRPSDGNLTGRPLSGKYNITASIEDPESTDVQSRLMKSPQFQPIGDQTCTAAERNLARSSQQFRSTGDSTSTAVESARSSQVQTVGTARYRRQSVIEDNPIGRFADGKGRDGKTSRRKATLILEEDEGEKTDEEVGEGSKLARSLVRLKSIIGKNKKHFGNNEELKDNNANLQLENLVREVLQNKNTPKPALTEETLFSTDNELDLCEVPPSHSPPLYYSPTSVAPPNLSSSQLSLYHHHHQHPPLSLKSPTLSVQSLSQQYNAHLSDSSHPTHLSATILKPSRCCCIHARSHGAVPSGSAPSGVSAGHGGIVPSGAIGIVPSGGVAAHGGVAPHWGTAPSGASVGHGGIPSWTGPSGAPSDEVPGRGKRKSLHAQDPESPAKASSKYSNNIFRSDETEWRTEPSSRAIKSFKDRLKGASPEIVNEKADRLSEVTRRGKRLSLSDDANKGGHLSKRFSVPLEPNKTEPTLVHSETQSTSNNASSVITHLMRPFHHQGASSSPSAVHSPLSTAVSSGTLDASGDPHRTSGLPSQAAQSDASSALPSNLPPATGPSLASDVAQRTSDLPSDTIQRVSNLPSDVGYRQDLPVQTSDLPSDAATRVPNLPSDARNDLPAHRTNLPDASHKSDLPPLSAQGGNAPTNLQSNTLHGQLQSNGGHSNVMPSNGGQSNAQTNEAQSGVSSNGVQSNAQPNGVSSNGVQSNVQTNGAQSRGVPSNGGQSIAQTNAILSNIMSSNISQSHGVSSNAGQSIAQTNGTHSNVSQSNGSHSEAQTGVPSAGVTLVKDLARAPLRDPVSHRSSISMSKSPHRRQSVIHQSPSLHQIAHQQNICCCQFQVPQSGQLEIEGNGEKFARTFSEDNKHSESYNEDLETDIMKRYDSVDTDYTFRQDALYRRIMEEAMMAAPTLSSSHLDLPNFDELYTEEDDEFRDYCQGVANYRLGNPGNAGPGNKRRSYMLATQQISSDSQDGDEPGRTTRSTDLLTGSDSERKKPWVTLVSYVDELTVGGRRDSQGRYIDGLGSFPGFGRDVIEKEPEDCFPEHCYQRCPCCLDLVQNFSQNSYWVALRRHILYIVDKPLFEWFILVLIFASSLTLCFEDIYLDTNLPLKRILYWVNLVFSVLFTIEMVFKWIALGFYKYFGSMWTLLDFFIVFVSVVSLLIEENENLKVLRSLRTLRALRPLRAISKWQGMRIVVNALMYAIPSIFNVLLVCLVFWLIFSIMGVQFFGGKFYKCLDENDELLPIEKVNDKFECLAKNYTWINSKITFDNVGDAYLALFQVATFEGWMEVMADAVDARGVDQQPQYEANLYAYIYFVIFIVCGSFFTLNLFIGVIIDNFNMLKKKYEGGVLEMFLTESQKHYYTAMKKLGRKKPQKVIKRPLNQFLAMFYDLSNSRRFEIAIFVLIFLNMLSMGIEHYDQNQVVFFVLEVSNAFFTTVFSLEALVKIIGLRYHYFTVPWNLFDFLLVLASILGILMEDIMIDFPVSPTLLRVVRVFRIGRILRLIKAAKGIRKLLFALVVSLPALFNIGALLGLITFIYAIIGMSVFGHVRHQRALDDMVNFETFGRSMQLLFRLMTSAGWNDVLESLMIQPPDCDMNYNNQPNGNCGYPLLAITYFTSFIIISYMIVINMYIAIILENFNQAHQEEEIGIVEDDLEMFYIRWSKFDPHATQFISFSQLADFIASLDPPLGIPKPNIVALVSFNLPIAKGNKIHCLDILHALVKHVLGHVEETEDFRKLQDQMDVKFKKQFPTRKELEIVSSTRLWKRQDKAARMIQRCYREYKRRRKELEAAQTVEEEDEITANSSPGGWQGRLSAFLHVHRGSRASSRKSSRASDAGSDASEMGAVWLNLPLFLLTGAQPGNGGPEETLKPSNDVCITVSNPSPETVLPNERDFMTSPPAGNMAGRHDSLDLPEGTGVEITVTEPSPDQDVKQAPIPDSTTPSVSRHGSSKSTKSMKRSSIKKPARSGKPSTSTQHDSSSTPASSSKECSPSALKRANTESCPPASVRRAIFRRSSEAAIGSTAIVQAASTIVTALVHRESEENESHDS